MVSMRISRVRCARNSTGPTTLAIARTNATVTDISGTNAVFPLPSPRTLRRTVSAKAKAARKRASVPCTNRSELKVRSSRGENWLLAGCNVTTVSEKVRDVTVIRDPEIACRTDVAASGPPLKRKAEISAGNSPSTPASNAAGAVHGNAATATASSGSGHSCVRRESVHYAPLPVMGNTPPATRALSHFSCSPVRPNTMGPPSGVDPPALEAG